MKQNKRSSKGWIHRNGGLIVLLCLLFVVSCQQETANAENTPSSKKIPESAIIELIEKIDFLSNRDKDSSMLLTDSLEQICRKQDFGYGLTKAYLFKSGLYGRSGDSKRAFNYLTKAYKLADSLRIDTLSSDLHTMFAVYYDMNGQPDKAIQESKKSIRYLEPTMYKRLSRAYCNLGYHYEHKDELESAFKYLKKGLYYAEKAASPTHMGHCYLGLGIIRALEGKFPESISYSKVADSIFRSTNNNYFLKDIQLNIGSTYIQMQEIDSALVYYKNSLNIRREIHDSIGLPSNFEAISLAYRDKKDFKNAHLYLDSCLYAERYVVKIQRLRELAEAEAKFQLHLKNKDILLLSKGKELQRNRIQHQRQWILILSLLAVLLTVIALFFIRNNALKKRKNELLELKNAHQLVFQNKLELDNLLLQQENLQSRYNSLKDQISPHFLFNSLNSLNGLILKDGDMAVKFVEELATVYRYLLKNSELSLVEIVEELKFLDAYFHLLKTRFGASVHLSVDLPAGIKSQYIAPLTLQLLVENAVKHNVVSKDKPLHIEIRSNKNQLIVSNNYQPKIQKMTSTKMGLQNIRKRYELLNRLDFRHELQKDVFTVWVPVINEQLED